MYENGANVTHRLLDGHPQLQVYPFESQLGTRFVVDHLTSMFPVKYRWPVFPSSASLDEIYGMIIDEEYKVRTRTPYVSKFREFAFEASDHRRKQEFIRLMKKKAISRPAVIEAFLKATFNTWKNYNDTDEKNMYVGYSPSIIVDADKIISDYNSNAYVLHIVRNPFSAYADTKTRAVPLSLDHYITGWLVNQYYAVTFAALYPRNCFIVRFEDIMKQPRKILGDFLKKIGIDSSGTLDFPSWNGLRLEQLAPWGVVSLTKKTIHLDKQEIREIRHRTGIYLKHFRYGDPVAGAKRAAAP